MQPLEATVPIVSRALECVVAGRRIAVPLIYVEKLVEYTRAPLPITHDRIGGLGVFEGTIVISLCLAPRGPADRLRRLTNAVLLRHLAGATPWALEVDDTLSFVELTADLHAPPSGVPWLSAASTVDGRAVEMLDVAALVASLAWAPNP